MKIWQVTINDTQIRFYFFAARKAAEGAIRKYREDPENKQYPKPQLEEVEVEPTRLGVTKALNWVIRLTCFNEG